MRSLSWAALAWLCLAATPLSAQQVAPVSAAKANEPDAKTLALWRQRWGYFVDMVGVPYALREVSNGVGNADFTTLLTWQVPGEVMLVTSAMASNGWKSETTMRWDQTSQRLIPQGSNDAFTVARPDGSLTTSSQVSGTAYRSSCRIRDDRSVECKQEQQQNGAWVFFSRSVQAPVEEVRAKIAREGADNLDKWVGKRLVSARAGRIIELQRMPGGGWSLSFFLPNGSPDGRFLMGAQKQKIIEAATPYAMAEMAFDNCDAELPDRQDAEGSVMDMNGGIVSFDWKCGKAKGLGFKGLHSYRYIVRPTSGGLAADYQHYLTTKGWKTADEWNREYEFVPVTDALVAEAASTYFRQQEEQRVAREAQMEEKRERNAKQDRIFGAVLTGLNVAADAYAQASAENAMQQAQQQAFLDGLQQQAKQAERTRGMQQQVAVGNGSSSGGYLLMEDKSKPAPAPVPTQPAPTPDRYGYCLHTTIGDPVDSGKLPRKFVSPVVRMPWSRVGGAGNNTLEQGFNAELVNQYGLHPNSGSSCSWYDSPQLAEQRRGEHLDDTGLFRIVETSISP